MNFLGDVQDPVQLASLYSALDFMVLLHVREGLPETGMEAMACGVPVLACNEGGVSQFIRPGQTGMLAEPDRVDDLARQIAWMTDHRFECLRMGFHARALAVKEFPAQQQVARYMELYQELTGAQATRAAARLSA